MFKHSKLMLLSSEVHDLPQDLAQGVHVLSESWKVGLIY